MKSFSVKPPATPWQPQNTEDSTTALHVLVAGQAALKQDRAGDCQREALRKHHVVDLLPELAGGAAPHLVQWW
jgi:hypothetical protein